MRSTKQGSADRRFKERPPLTAEQQKLVESNVKFAYCLARQHLGRILPMCDREQVACVGLIHAAQNYDGRPGTTFLSFARHRIIGEIHEEERRQFGGLVHMPRDCEAIGVRLMSRRSLPDVRYANSLRAHHRYQMLKPLYAPEYRLEPADDFLNGFTELSTFERDLLRRRYVDAAKVKDIGRDLGVSERYTITLFQDLHTRIREFLTQERRAS